MEDDLQDNFLTPGAVHKARIMEKQLCCYKIVFLQDNLPHGIASKAHSDKLQRTVNFGTYVFNIWCFQSPFATSAPAFDTEFIRNL